MPKRGLVSPTPASAGLSAGSGQGRVPPYSADAEAAVLGSILLNNQALSLIQDQLSADDFYLESHRLIYAAIHDLSLQGTPIDYVTLGTELTKRGDLEKIGGVAAIENLTHKVATVANVEHYATIILEKSSVRRMIYAAQQIVADGFGDMTSADEFLDKSEKTVFEASQKRIGESYVHIGTPLHAAMRNLEAAAKRPDTLTGLTTGFRQLDKITAGLQPSDLIIVAGRPAMGKTSFAMNLAFNAAVRGEKPVLVFSLEMSKEQLVRRLLSSEGHIDASKMRQPHLLSPEDWRKITDTMGFLYNVPIYLDDSTPMTPVEIRAKSRRLKAEKKDLGLIVIDYLQLMQSSSRRASSNREQEIAEISRSLKLLAKELEVPVVALSQLNRGLEARQDKRPILSDLRESGAIEQDADMILFVYREKVYKPDYPKGNEAEIIVRKQRSGPTGTCFLSFTEMYTRFDNLVHDEPIPEGGSEPPTFSDY
ncbi:MAG: replicative DNA helicase [Proteobacteria bacterium]|nr:replicative DNA helicase [Pseudomonadota bacterium]